MTRHFPERPVPWFPALSHKNSAPVGRLTSHDRRIVTTLSLAIKSSLPGQSTATECKNCAVPRVPTRVMYPRHDYPYLLSHIRFFDFGAILTLTIEYHYGFCTNHLSAFCTSSQSVLCIDCHCNAVITVTPCFVSRDVSGCPATSTEFRL